MSSQPARLALWAVLVGGAYWVVHWNDLRGIWTHDDQYGYGWFVPLLAGAFVYLRWPSRPPAQEVSIRTPVLAGAAAILLLALWPLRWLEGANPGWRMAYWVHAILLVGLTLLAWYFFGGSGWLRHFLFPTLFLLTAVPWPSGFEAEVVQTLMRWITSATVEAMVLLGLPAVAQGNVIQTSAGPVGIEEACSGVRSLQTGIMLALVIGELRSFTTKYRVILLLGTLLIALIGNLCRSVFLLWTAFQGGLAEVNRLHDPAGQGVLAIVCIGAVLLGLLLRRGSIPHAVNAAPNAGQLRAIRPIFCAGVALWLVATEVSVRAWYQLRSSSEARWSVVWPTDRSRYTELPLNATVRKLLKFDEGHAASWVENTESREVKFALFFFRWKPRLGRWYLTLGHRPTDCLNGVGLEPIADHGTRLWPVGKDLSVPFHHFEFANASRSIHVFYCIWENQRGVRYALRQELTRDDRIRAAFNGWKDRGQQSFELVMIGPKGATPAEELFATKLKELVHPE